MRKGNRGREKGERGKKRRKRKEDDRKKRQVKPWDFLSGRLLLFPFAFAASRPLIVLSFI